MSVGEVSTPNLRLRPLELGDLPALVDLAGDERVMASLGGTMTPEKTAAWLDGLLGHWRSHGYGRFAVSHGGAFVGVVGLSRTDFDAGVVPGVEMAWRLAFDQWGKGFATEAARAALADGFDRVGLDAVIAVTSTGNLRSRRVMERLGMEHAPAETFEHPRLAVGHPLREHVVYRLREGSSRSSRG